MRPEKEEAERKNTVWSHERNAKKNSMRIPVSRLQNNARPRKRVSPPIAEFVQISGIQRVNAIMNGISYIEDLRQMRSAQYWKL